MITLNDVGIADRRQTLLQHCSASFAPGSLTAIVGESASGKTILAELLTTVRKPTSGDVTFDGASVNTMPPAILKMLRQKIGVIDHLPRLIETMTVAENVALPLSLAKAPQALLTTRTEETLAALNCLSLWDAFPTKLSDSQRMLVTIARVIAQKPFLVVADDPFELLDQPQSELAATALLRLNRERTTVIILTDHLSIATALHAKVLYLKEKTIVEGAGAGEGQEGRREGRKAEDERRKTEKQNDESRVTSDENTNVSPSTPDPHPDLSRDLSSEALAKEEAPAKGEPEPAPPPAPRKIRVTAVGSGIKREEKDENSGR